MTGHMPGHIESANGAEKMLQNEVFRRRPPQREGSCFRPARLLLVLLSSLLSTSFRISRKNSASRSASSARSSASVAYSSCSVPFFLEGSPLLRVVTSFVLYALVKVPRLSVRDDSGLMRLRMADHLFSSMHVRFASGRSGMTASKAFLAEIRGR